ncbi:MAG: MFS transporter [Syntrophales bacterium]|nr:MFS transporter [Syntrophales bacterium]
MTILNSMPLYFTFALVLFNMTSVQAGRVLLALYALKLGAQPFAVGILAATFSVLPMLLSWQVGKLSDRFGSRWPLLFGAAGGACGMLVPYYIPGLPALYVAAVMNGLSFAFFAVSLQNVVGLLSEPHNRALNFSNFSLIVSVTTFIGPLFAGFSIDNSGPALACLYLVALSLLPVLMLVIGGSSLPRGSRDALPAGSVRDMLTGSGLWKVLMTSSLVVTGIALFQFYIPIYGHGIGLSASTIGVVLAMFSAAAFVVRLIMPRLISWFSESTVLAYAFFLGAASLMLVPFFKSAVVLALLSFAFGLGMGCGQPITMMLTYSNSTEGHSGEVLGLRITTNHLARMIGPLVFGAIGSALGIFPMFWINALMLVSGGTLTLSGRIGKKRKRQ